MSLRILKASAGSGKTYSLTESYIRYCLDKNNALDFANILAITFTNKASGEMKDRIIELLDTLSKDPKAYSGIDKLSSDLGMSLSEIQRKSQQTLNRILKEFDLFTITTIDSFFTRLYGSMTLDLFGDPPRDITFDQDKALQYATDRLLEAAQADQELQGVVLDLLEEKVKEGGGVNLKYDIQKLGNELFNDEYLQLRNKTSYVIPVKDFHKALAQTLEYMQATFQEYQDKLSQLLTVGGMQHTDFYRNFTKSILNKTDVLDLYGLASFQRLSNPDQWFTSKEKDLMMVKVAPIMEELMTLGQEFIEFVEKNYRLYATYSLVIDNYAAYRVLRFLDRAVNKYVQEQRLIFLSDINFKISQNISSEDSMVVYEKLGQRLHAVMIDEFQDTSQIQWNNLKPLVSNNMAEGHPNLVVGDVKQAIYRFRNGNWEIMEIQVPAFKKEWSGDNPELFEDLEYNWRSSPEIVNFNNSFFTELSGNLSNILTEFQTTIFSTKSIPDYLTEVFRNMELLADAPRKIYGSTFQKVPDKNRNQNGYVEIDYWTYKKGTDKTELQEERMAWLKDTLESLFSDGFRGADIGILARGRKELTQISENLTRWSEENPLFRFSSEDSLRLDLSDGVQLLIAGLKIKTGIDVKINKMVFANYYLKLRQLNLKNPAWVNALPENSDEIEILQNVIFQQDGIEQLSIFFETLIDHTNLNDIKGQWPFLLSFIEEVKKFELQHGPDIPLFLEDWDQRIRAVKIKMSDDIEKIRLYTIHKSKGLEFDVVLIPFGDWDFESRGKQNILWVNDQQDSLLKLAGPLPVSYKNDLFLSNFDYALMIEYLRVVVDNLNLLYVAMTRPRQQLYIRLQEQEKSDKKKSNSTPGKFNKPITNTLDLFLLSHPDMTHGKISKGTKPIKTVPSSVESQSQNVPLQVYNIRQKPLSLHLRPSFDGSENESVGQGLIIHNMLEGLKYHSEIQIAISKAVLAGDIRNQDREEWSAKLRGIVEFDPVKNFFDESWKVYNEKSIMVHGGGEFRPDRVQENGKKYVIIDYKSGVPKPEHHRQLKNYKTILKDMVALPVRAYIYYLFTPELVEVE